MLQFLKVFESPHDGSLRSPGLLSALWRMLLFCVAGLLFVLTVYTLW